MNFEVLFLNVFQKWRKCEISEDYNAKRGSEPSKSSDVCIDFSLNFHVFPNTLPEVIFRGTLRRSRPKRAIVNGFWDPAGFLTELLERHFLPKRRRKGSIPNARERPGADLGAIWRRKRSKDAFS